MQVAMRLGPYWWKKFGEKKIGEERISKWIAWLILFLGTASITSVIFLLLPEDIINANEIAKTGSGLLILVVLAISATIIGTSIATIFCLFVVGIAVARVLFASLRFKTVFGFSPPVTDEGHKTLESTIKYMLSIRAHALNEVYEREKRAYEIIKERGNRVNPHDDNGLLQIAGRFVASMEHALGNLEKEKKRAKKGFYSARDAAVNPFLPVPFKNLPDSLKEYLNYLPKKER